MGSVQAHSNRNGKRESLFISLETYGIFHTRHNRQERYLLPLVVVGVIRKGEGVVPVEHVVNADIQGLRMLAAGKLYQRADIPADIGRHTVVVERRVELLFHQAGDEVIVPPASGGNRLPVPGLPGEKGGDA